jgi:hypothetical protein
MNLTKQNYFTTENKFISNSRIGDFLKDKHYFYQKHITGEIENKKTIPMLVGGAVDTWLTRGKDAFLKEYNILPPKTKRNLKNPPIGIIELTQAQGEEIISICKSVESQDAFKELADHEKQRILTMDMDLGLFKGICGVPDFFKIDGKTAILTDLKTAERADSPIKYYYHCLDYSYFRQAAFYKILLRYNFKEVEKITFRHLTVQKDVDQIHKVYTFILDDERISMEEENILTNILPEIAKEKDFLPNNVKWSDARTIGSINEDF